MILWGSLGVVDIETGKCNYSVFLGLVGFFGLRERTKFPKITMTAMTVVVVVVSICSFESDSLEVGLCKGVGVAESFNGG